METRCFIILLYFLVEADVSAGWFPLAMSLGKRVSWLDNNASCNLRCEVPNASAACASSATAQCFYHVFEAAFATQSTIAGGKIICFAPCDADETRAYFTLYLGWERF